jgi:subtilisin family serine protease
MTARPLTVAVALCAMAVGAGGVTAQAAAPDSAGWALDAIHAASASRPPTAGRGVVVAVLDSGVDAAHPAFRGRVIAGPDLVTGGRATTDPVGHGTHLAGLIAGAPSDGFDGGVAPGATILSIRVLDAANQGRAADLARGIDAAVLAGADVINLSMNWPESASSAVAGPAVGAALGRAAAAGIAVIVAAGNGGLDSCEEPARPEQTLCVGALDQRLQLASYSSHGDGLGVVAPGSEVTSTAPGGGTDTLTGTSQAAAVVSGVAVLLAGQGLRGRAIIARITATARDLGAPGYDARNGFGLVDAARATDGAAQGTMPPSVTVSAPRRVSLGEARRRGLPVTCDAVRAGRCAVTVRARGTVIARTSRRVTGAGPVRIMARLTAAGRRLVDRDRSVTGRILARAPGAPAVARSVQLHR